MNIRGEVIWVSTLRTITRLSPEAGWVVAGQLLSAAGGLLGVRLLTGLLAPSEYGRLALAMTVVGIAQQTMFGPVNAALLRFYAPAREAGELASFGRTARRFAGASAMSLLIAGGALLALAVERWGFDRTLALGTLGVILASGYGSTLDALQSAARRRTLVALHQGLGQVGRALAAAGLCGLVGGRSSAALAGYAVAAAIVALSQRAFLASREPELFRCRQAAEPAGPWGDRLWGYAWPFAFWGLFTWAQSASDRWALQAFAGTAAVGTYAVVFQLGYYPISLASNSLVLLLAPILFDQAGDARDPTRMKAVRDSGRRLLRLVLALTVGATLLAAVLHRPLFSVLVAEQYRSASGLLPLIVLAAGLFACGQVAVLPLLSEERTLVLLPPKVLTAVAGVGLNLAGAYLLGVKGVVLAGTTFGAGYLAWILLLTRRRHWQTQ